MAGNGRQRTDLATAARAAAMYQAGIPVKDISGETGLPKRTIYRILSGDHNWDEILRNDERYKLYKDATTRGLEVNCWELAKKSFIHAEEKLPEAAKRIRRWVVGADADDMRLILRALDIQVKASRDGVEIEGILPVPEFGDQDLVTIVQTSA